MLISSKSHLKPGGHIEVAEVRTWLWCGDNTFPEDSYTNKMQVRDLKMPIATETLILA